MFNIPDKLEEEVLMYLSDGLINDLIIAAMTNDSSDWFFFEESIKDFVDQRTNNV